MKHCLDCNREVGPKNKSGRCASCAQKRALTPEVIARRAATLRARMEAEPELRAKYRDRIVAQTFGEANEHRLKRMIAAKLPDWLPVEYRPLYRELLHGRKAKASELKPIIMAQIEADRAIYRRTGRLPQSERMAA